MTADLSRHTYVKRHEGGFDGVALHMTLYDEDGEYGTNMALAARVVPEAGWFRRARLRLSVWFDPDAPASATSSDRVSEFDARLKQFGAKGPTTELRVHQSSTDDRVGWIILEDENVPELFEPGVECPATIRLEFDPEFTMQELDISEEELEDRIERGKERIAAFREDLD